MNIYILQSTNFCNSIEMCRETQSKFQDISIWKRRTKPNLNICRKVWILTQTLPKTPEPLNFRSFVSLESLPGALWYHIKTVSFHCFNNSQDLRNVKMLNNTIIQIIWLMTFSWWCHVVHYLSPYLAVKRIFIVTICYQQLHSCFIARTLNGETQ